MVNFEISFDDAFGNNRIKSLSGLELAEILNNYNIIEFLKREFGQVHYYTKNGLIQELDLSDVSTHVFGWKILRKLLHQCHHSN